MSLYNDEGSEFAFMAQGLLESDVNQEFVPGDSSAGYHMDIQQPLPDITLGGDATTRCAITVPRQELAISDRARSMELYYNTAPPVGTVQDLMSLYNGEGSEFAFMAQGLLESDVNQEFVPGDSSAGYHMDIQQPLPDVTLGGGATLGRLSSPRFTCYAIPVAQQKQVLEKIKPRTERYMTPPLRVVEGELAKVERYTTPPLLAKGELAKVGGSREPREIKGCERSVDVCRESLEDGPIKRYRSPNWNPTETQAYLHLKEVGLGVVTGKDWDFISRGLRDVYGFDRSPECCEYLWGTLLKNHRDVRKHESSTASGALSYWDMDEDGRSKHKLPRSLSWESYATMERILAIKERRILGHVKSLDCHGDQFVAGLAPFVNHQVGDAVNSALDCLRPSCEESIPGATYGDGDPVASLALQLTQLVKNPLTSAIQDSMPRQNISTADDDAALISRVAAVLRQLIAEEVRSALAPVSSALLTLDHDDRMYERKIRALAEKKRAIALEEMQLLKRQRVASRRRRTSRKPQGSARITPALQDLSITRDHENLGRDHLASRNFPRGSF